MAYSKAYQEVVAGRVRETEAIGFFKNNEVAVPGRTTASNPVGGKTQPTVDVDHFNDPNIAKPNTTKDPDKSAYHPNRYNVSS